MNLHLTRIFVALAALASVFPAAASEIYHWVDAQGVNHFSQSPPPDADKEVRTLQVDGSQPASYDPEEDRYNVAAQQEAMQAKRDQMAESRANNQPAQPASNDTTVIYYPQNEAYNQVLYPPGFRPLPPGNRPRPPGNRPRPPGNKPDRPETLPEEITPPASHPFRRPRG